MHQTTEALAPFVAGAVAGNDSWQVFIGFPGPPLPWELGLSSLAASLGGFPVPGIQGLQIHTRPPWCTGVSDMPGLLLGISGSPGVLGAGLFLWTSSPGHTGAIYLHDHPSGDKEVEGGGETNSH